jgi:hypothetical protein
MFKFLERLSIGTNGQKHQIYALSAMTSYDKGVIPRPCCLSRPWQGGETAPRVWATQNPNILNLLLLVVFSAWARSGQGWKVRAPPERSRHPNARTTLCVSQTASSSSLDKPWWVVCDVLGLKNEEHPHRFLATRLTCPMTTRPEATRGVLIGIYA